MALVESAHQAGRRPNAPRGDAVQVSSPAPRDLWESLLAGDRGALVSQSPAWTDCICAFGYEDASRLYELPGGARFVLPMVSSSRLPPALATRASMPPAWGMGGLIGERPPGEGDIETIVADLRAGRELRTSIRPNPLHAAQWSAAAGPGVTAIPRLAHVLRLEGGQQQVWRNFSKSARQGVRKGLRSGLEIECDTSGRLLPVFFDLMELSIARWAGQQHEPLWLARWRARRRDPEEKFRRMAGALGETMRVWVAWKNGRAAASMIVLLGTNATDTRGVMNKELAGPSNANDLLQWHAIQDACQAGCVDYHLGESGSSRSLAHYKEKFGARGVPYHEYRIERLPLTSADLMLRQAVKRVLGFRDVTE